MRKIILAAICATAIGVVPVAAFAQTTGPAGQDATKMGTETGAPATGMSKSSTKSSMHKSMKKSSMKKSSMMKSDTKK